MGSSFAVRPRHRGSSGAIVRDDGGESVCDRTIYRCEAYVGSGEPGLPGRALPIAVIIIMEMNAYPKEQWWDETFLVGDATVFWSANRVDHPGLMSLIWEEEPFICAWLSSLGHAGAVRGSLGQIEAGTDERNFEVRARRSTLGHAGIADACCSFSSKLREKLLVCGGVEERVVYRF